MRKLVAATALALALTTSGAHAALFYEPFDYAEGNLGLNVNPSVNQTWYTTATSGADDRVQVTSAATLSTPGMPASVGRGAAMGGAGRTDRIFIGQNRTTGTVYYSLMMKVTDLTGTGATGASVFGFNNTPQTLVNHDTAAQPSAISGRLLVKAIDASTYQVGASKASGGAADFVYSPTAYNINTDTVLVVGRYTFNTVSATDDVFDVWVNPSSSTFADNSLMPAPTVTTALGADGGQIATVIMRQFTAVIPAGIQFDELRVDTSWENVTSNLVPEPASLTLLASAAAVMMLARRRSRGNARAS